MERPSRSRGYSISLSDIAFGDIVYKLQFKDIIETEDGWEPKEKKEILRNRCERLYNRNSTMELRKGDRLYR